MQRGATTTAADVITISVVISMFCAGENSVILFNYVTRQLLLAAPFPWPSACLEGAVTGRRTACWNECNVTVQLGCFEWLNSRTIF